MSGWFTYACEAVAAKWRWFWGIRDKGLPETDRMRLGRMGEDAAEAFIRQQGWKIIVRNWRHGRDELDLVARDGETLVFCEVRTRNARALVTGYFSVTRRKKRAVARATKAYLRGLAETPRHFRFDIIEVKVSDGQAQEVLHHASVPLFSQSHHTTRPK